MPDVPADAPRTAPPPDRDTAAWWDATRHRRLLVQRCADCGHHQHYPRALCTSCGGPAVTMVPSEGRGVVETFTVVHRAPRPDLTPPYVVALVRLAEGPTLMTNIVGGAPTAVRIGMPVHLTWQALPDGRNLPMFTVERGSEWTSG